MVGDESNVDPAIRRRISLSFPWFHGISRLLLKLRTLHWFWEITFAIFLAAWGAYYFAGFDRPKYKLYVLIGDDIPNTFGDEIRQRLKQISTGISINDIEVTTEIIDVPAHAPSAAVAKAQYIINNRDALMVVGILDSEPTEKALPFYLHTRPQIPFLAAVQTNNNLLRNCSDCFEGDKPVPLLQMSPTNADQAKWAIKFAEDRATHPGVTNFLIVSDDGSPNQSYVRGLADAYDKEIPSTDSRLGTPVSNVTAALSRKPDWILFAGDPGNAQVLLGAVAQEILKTPAATPQWNPIVVLSDTAVPPTLKSVQYSRIVNLTDQSDASYYSDSNQPNAYAVDSITVAATLLKDVEERGYDWRFWLKWGLLNRASAEDLRRNLVRNMREDFKFDRSYRGADDTGPLPGLPAAYSFDCPVSYAGKIVHKSDGSAEYCQRYGGIFHVWNWNPKCHAMTDVDSWHPTRKALALSGCNSP